MDFHKLLQTEFERKGLKSVQQKAEQSGFNTEYLRQVLHGNKVPSDDMIVEACEKMKLSTDKTRELLLAAAKDRAKEDNTKATIDRVFATSEAHGNCRPVSLPITDFYTVPVWSSVQAGTGQLSEKSAEVVDEVLLTADEYKAKCFAIQINGSSMEPEIIDGDIGVFEPPNGLQPAENDVVVVELEGHGQWMVKRLKVVGSNRIELLSTNSKEYPPIKINLDAQNVAIKGILLRTVRKFKKRLFLK